MKRYGNNAKGKQARLEYGDLQGQTLNTYLIATLAHNLLTRSFLDEHDYRARVTTPSLLLGSRIVHDGNGQHRQFLQSLRQQQAVQPRTGHQPLFG